jgi:hypothetical protein
MLLTSCSTPTSNPPPLCPGIVIVEAGEQFSDAAYNALINHCEALRDLQ